MNISAKRKRKSKEQEKINRILARSINNWSGLTTSNHLDYLTKYPLTPQEVNYKWEIWDDNKE